MAEAREIIEGVKDDEQAAYDNLPEGFQNGDQGSKMQECIDAMDDIDSSLQEAIDRVDDAKGTS